MKRKLLVCLLSLNLLLGGAAQRHRDDGDDEEFKAVANEQETIQKAFQLSGEGGRSLDVDNVFGSIEVIGTSSNQVQLTAVKRIRAASQAELARAKKEVTLDLTQDGNAVRFFVNGPFRCNHDCGNCFRHEDYEVIYDFKVQVPERIALKLRTVNKGFIRVKGVRGDYSVGNVNGPIDMDEVGGSGRVHTVNGRVKVTFAENPSADSEFATINGNVDLYFTPKLAADFRFKTMQGGVYSDFPMTQIPLTPGKAERKEGRFVYRSDRYTGGRVGHGGPDIKLENLNGDLRVLARSNQ